MGSFRDIFIRRGDITIELLVNSSTHLYQKITLVVLKKTELKCWLLKKTPNLQFESVYHFGTDDSQNKLIREKGHDLYLSALLCFVERFFYFVFFFRS